MMTVERESPEATICGQLLIVRNTLSSFSPPNLPPNLPTPDCSRISLYLTK